MTVMTKREALWEILEKLSEIDIAKVLVYARTLYEVSLEKQ